MAKRKIQSRKEGHASHALSTAPSASPTRWPTIDDLAWREVWYPTWQNHYCDVCGATITHNFKIYYANGGGLFRHVNCHAKATN